MFANTTTHLFNEEFITPSELRYNFSLISNILNDRSNLSAAYQSGNAFGNLVNYYHDMKDRYQNTTSATNFLLGLINSTNNYYYGLQDIIYLVDNWEFDLYSINYAFSNIRITLYDNTSPSSSRIYIISVKKKKKKTL
jgi:hypothetical protein